MANNINRISNHLQNLSEQQTRVLLRAEGQRLEKIARKIWKQYLSSYRPVEYVRTGDAMDSIKLGQVKRVGGMQLGIELTWENDLAYHDSVFKNNKTQGHAIMLISDGWHARKLENRIGKVHRFTYFEGTGYLYRVYKEYMATAPPNMTLDVQWSGKYTR